MRFTLQLFSMYFIYTNNPAHGTDLTNYTCYNDSFELYDAMTKYSDIPKTFHVCPNTKFKIGWYNSTTEMYSGGDQAITIVNSGTKVLCGQYGDLADNCTLAGGESGIELISGRQFFGGNGSMVLEDLLIQGFKFTDANNTISIWSPGWEINHIGLTVKHCRFMDNPKLITNIELFVPWGTEEVTVEECYFENQYVVADDNYLFGSLIHTSISTDPQINISRSKFFNNSFDESYLIASLIYVPSQSSTPYDSNTKISIEESCIQGNRGMTSFAYSDNVMEEQDKINNNLQALNEFKNVSYACYGIARSNVLDLEDAVKSLACSISGFQEQNCKPNQEPPTSSDFTHVKEIRNNTMLIGLVWSMLSYFFNIFA